MRFYGIDQLGFTLSSFRAGGATGMLEDGVPVAVIKYSGGWSADKSLASYLQEAESALALLRISDVAAARLKLALREFVHPGHGAQARGARLQ